MNIIKYYDTPDTIVALLLTRIINIYYIIYFSIIIVLIYWLNIISRNSVKYVVIKRNL